MVCVRVCVSVWCISQILIVLKLQSIFRKTSHMCNQNWLQGKLPLYSLLTFFRCTCFIIMCVSVLSACMCVHAWCLWCQKRTSDPFELKLQMVGSCPVGAGNWISTRTLSVHNCWAIASPPADVFSFPYSNEKAAWWPEPIYLSQGFSFRLSSIPLP